MQQLRHAFRLCDHTRRQINARDGVPALGKQEGKKACPRANIQNVQLPASRKAAGQFVKPPPILSLSISRQRRAENFAYPLRPVARHIFLDRFHIPSPIKFTRCFEPVSLCSAPRRLLPDAAPLPASGCAKRKVRCCLFTQTGSNSSAARRRPFLDRIIIYHAEFYLISLPGGYLSYDGVARSLTEISAVILKCPSFLDKVSPFL